MSRSSVNSTSDIPPRPHVCVNFIVRAGRRTGRAWSTRWSSTTRLRSRSVSGWRVLRKTERQMRTGNPGLASGGSCSLSRPARVNFRHLRFPFADLLIPARRIYKRVSTEARLPGAWPWWSKGGVSGDRGRRQGPDTQWKARRSPADVQPRSLGATPPWPAPRPGGTPSSACSDRAAACGGGPRRGSPR